MGVDPCALRFLILASQTGVNFDRSLMLGRQHLHCATWEIDLALRSLRLPPSHVEAIASASPFADGLFSLLGASSVDSMDASDYEGATLIHSLNQPIPAEWDERYTAVFDGGTLEHVFDVRTGWANALRLVAVGGHFIGVTTANNHLGHGFYQFSPEFFFRVFSPENGYDLEGVFLFEQAGHGFDRSEVYEVGDPAALGRRVNLVNAHPTLVLCRARRTSSIIPLAAPAIQSDYAVKWEAAPAQGRRASRPMKEKLRGIRFAMKRRFRSADRLRHGLNASRSPSSFDPTAYRCWTLDASMARRWSSDKKAPLD